MSAEPNTPEPSPPLEQDTPLDAPLDTRLNAYLFDLLDVGAKVLQSVARQADLQAQPTPEGEAPHPVVDVAEQYERVSRAIRRNILLIRHIAQGRAAENGSRTNPARHRTEARKRIVRAVEDAIGCGSESEREARDIEGLRAEFHERLDAPDLEDEIAHRPVADIVKDICRDLGFNDPLGYHVHRRRTPRDVEALNARAAAPPPPGPYNPGPHGPDPGAPEPSVPLKPIDPARERWELDEMTRTLAG